MTDSPGELTILVVDDHPVVRHGLEALLSAQDWVARVLSAGTVRQAKQLAVTDHPDVAVVDLALPDGDGAELVGYLRAAAPQCGTVVLSMTNDPGVIRAVLEAGASGYLLKETSPDLVLAAVRTVAGGGRALGPEVALEEPGQRRSGRQSPLGRLTGRERQVLGLLAAGKTNGDIAKRLYLSEKTVRNQISTLVSKLGVDNRVQAALLAREHGLTGEDPEAPRPN
jgi:DNA-binding NarL/FixJ family response regulator